MNTGLHPLRIVAVATAGLRLARRLPVRHQHHQPGAAQPQNFKYGRGDGQTMASAVEIRTRSETDGGLLIRNWIKANYPGFTIQEQELIEARDKAFNLITIIGPSNTAQRLTSTSRLTTAASATRISPGRCPDSSPIVGIAEDTSRC